MKSKIIDQIHEFAFANFRLLSILLSVNIQLSSISFHNEHLRAKNSRRDEKCVFGFSKKLLYLQVTNP